MAEAHLRGHYDHLVATSPWPAVGAIGAFALATGFHGAHVIIGTIFLTVYLIHAAQGHFKPDHHFGLEAAAWYWHFVDVVWLFLFACIYWRGRAGATIHCGGPVAGVCQ